MESEIKQRFLRETRSVESMPALEELPVQELIRLIDVSEESRTEDTACNYRVSEDARELIFQSEESYLKDKNYFFLINPWRFERTSRFMLMANSLEKSAVYIDGSNFYFSVKNTFKYKVDIGKFCKKLTKDSDLAKISYYIAPLNRIDSPERYIEQQKFFDRLKKIEKLKIILGRLEKYKKDGKILLMEKATDVNLAMDIILDAVDNIYDKAYLISNDGDFSEAVSAVIERFKKKVTYVAIGNNKSISHHLKKVASNTLRIQEDFIEDCKI